MKYKVEKICKNCDNQGVAFCKNNHQYENCKNFVLRAEIHELAHELEYDGIEIVEPTIKKEPFLTNTGVKNCYTKKPFFKLNQKLSREEWKAVKQYFKYYNFNGLHGWATTKVHDVTEVLVSLRDTKYNEIKEQITFHEKEKYKYEIEHFEEHEGKAFNLKLDLDRLVSAYYPH